MWLDLIGMILIAGAIKLNLSESCTDVCSPVAVASIDLCLPVSVTNTKDIVELKLKHDIYLRTNDLCVETKIFSTL